MYHSLRHRLRRATCHPDLTWGLLDDTLQVTFLFHGVVADRLRAVRIGVNVPSHHRIRPMEWRSDREYGGIANVRVVALRKPRVRMLDNVVEIHFPALLLRVDGGDDVVGVVTLSHDAFAELTVSPQWSLDEETPGDLIAMLPWLAVV